MSNDTHSESRDARADKSHSAFPVITVIGAGVVLGAAVAIRGLRRTARGRDASDRTTALATYLREHLSGSDSAIRVVERLRRTHAGTAEGSLFAALFADFQREREVVRAVLDEIGASTLSAKRLVTEAGGAVMAPMVGGTHGGLALFRTLEALAIGVQGKRLLWRAMQHVEPEFTQASRSRLRELELLAVRQWETIDERRRTLVQATFTAGSNVDGATQRLAQMGSRAPPWHGPCSKTSGGNFDKYKEFDS